MQLWRIWGFIWGIAIHLRLVTAAIFIFLSMAGVVFAVYIMFVASSAYVYFFGIFLLVLSIIAGFFNIVSAYFYYKSFFYGDYLAKITQGLRPSSTCRRWPLQCHRIRRGPRDHQKDAAPA